MTYICVMNKTKNNDMKSQMTEKQADTILRENLHDARYMQQQYELEGNDELSWYYQQTAMGLRTLLMFGTLEEKLKIADPQPINQ